jgi:dCTP deaminase
MVLSDNTIKRMLRTKQLVIRPLLSNTQISGAKIDLRLSNTVFFIRHYEKPYYDPMVDSGEESYGDLYNVPFDRGIVLQPGDFAIAPLFEKVILPPNVMGRLDGRSSLGRLGISVQITSPGIDPGFSGEVVCELSNSGRIPVSFYPLMRIASLALEETDKEVDTPYLNKPDRKYPGTLHSTLSNDYEFKSGLLKELGGQL